MEKTILSQMSDELLYECLKEGVKENNVNLIRAVLDETDKLQKKFFMFQAIEDANDKVIYILLDEGVVPDDNTNWLVVAINFCNDIVLKRLIEQDTRKDGYIKELETACDLNRVNIIDLLIKKGANITLFPLVEMYTKVVRLLEKDRIILGEIFRNNIWHAIKDKDWEELIDLILTIGLD